LEQKPDPSYRTPDGPWQPQPPRHWFWSRVCDVFGHNWWELMYIDPDDVYLCADPKFCTRCRYRDYDGLDFKKFQAALDQAKEWFDKRIHGGY
jgi:hypothetical protein